MTGIARGIDDAGHLLLDSDGIIITINSGTVRLA